MRVGMGHSAMTSSSVSCRSTSDTNNLVQSSCSQPRPVSARCWRGVLCRVGVKSIGVSMCNIHRLLAHEIPWPLDGGFCLRYGLLKQCKLSQPDSVMLSRQEIKAREGSMGPW